MRTADPSADGRRSAAIFAAVEVPSAGCIPDRLAAPGAIPVTVSNEATDFVYFAVSYMLFIVKCCTVCARFSDGAAVVAVLA